MMKKIEKMKNELLERIAEKEDTKVMITFSCEPINVYHYSDFVIDDVELSDNELVLVGIDCNTFTIGLKDVNIEHNEIDNEYIFTYSNGVQIQVTVF